MRDQRFAETARALGYAFDGEIRVGDHYAPLVRDGHVLCVSGQIPRVGESADGASGLLLDILGPADAHTRTSACVLQLPKTPRPGLT